MSLSDISIRRPVLAAVASLLIIVFGLASMGRLPIRELPDVDTAVVSVSTQYTGASPEIVDTDITEIIEGAIAGISGVKTISSQSRRGRSRTVVEFVVGRNIDEATNDIRAAVSRVRGRLPEETDEPQIYKNDNNADPVMRIAVTSDRMSGAELTDYVDRYIVDRLSTLDGVASVTIFGERRYAIRVWLDRRALAARDLTVADVEQALRRNNLELPAGDIESLQRQLTVRLNSRIASVEQFRNIVISRVAGYPIRLSDVAHVEQGVEDDSTIVRANGVQALSLNILRQSQANTIAISQAVHAELEALRPLLPEGMELSVGSDDATFIGASIREVIIALGLSLVLVVLVILAFLRSVRATLVPAVTIPVALIGCFILINALGFSINVLTLLALLLAIGIVVDDAIVMLENIQRRIDLGESPLVASSLGARQVTFAVLATSVTLISVFVPISFLQGQAGKLFTEFGFVLASAVVISTFVALSLCPVLASRLLTPSPNAVPAPAAAAGSAASDAALAGSRAGRFYRKRLSWALNRPLVILLLAGGFSGVSVAVYQFLPSELTPAEDRGVFFVPLTTPQGSTVEYTSSQSEIVERAAAPLMADGSIDMVFSNIGRWGEPHRAFMVMRMVPWEKRDKTQTEVIRELAPSIAEMPGARGFPFGPTALGLRGGSMPLRVVISGPDFARVKEWAGALLVETEKNPNLRNPEIDFEENQPQLDLTVDRERADDLGIAVETIATTLQTMLASREITTYVDRGREYPVIVQARDSDRRTPNDISNIFVRSGDGKTLVPLSSLIAIQENAAAPSLRRYDRLPSITLQAGLADGYALGSAIADMEKSAARILPPEAKVSLAGQSRTFMETSGGIAVTFALALVIVFLVLAAQFESFLHPFIIMLSVPLAVAGAVYTLWLAGITLNLYSQIGAILLIGLMAKNGILIVEFANQLRDAGKDVREAVTEAAVLRLRPILMTVLSTILGAVPLAVASGAGAESRSAIGVVIIGGLGFATVLTLFLTPVLYNLLAGFTRPRGAIERALEAELDGISAMPRS